MRARLASILALVVLAAALAAPPAAAQARRKPPTKAQLREAKAHFEKGDAHYAAKEWDQAIAEFQAAFDLAGAPLLMFNIAQSHRLKGEPERALDAYRRYLELEPNPPNRADVEGLMKAQQAAIDAREPPPAVKPPPVVKPPVAV